MSLAVTSKSQAQTVNSSLRRHFGKLFVYFLQRRKRAANQKRKRMRRRRRRKRRRRRRRREGVLTRWMHLGTLHGPTNQ